MSGPAGDATTGDVTTGDVTWDLDTTVGVGRRIMTALGTPPDVADRVARSLAEANLCGHDSHGVIRLPWYADFVTQGHAVPDARPVVDHTTGAVSVVDGRRCWGQLAGHFAVDVAGAAALSHGVGVVAVRRANHLGRLGEYAERLVADGLVAILWANADPCMAPYGGRERLLGTNPFAVGVPTSGPEPPVVVDFATAAVAEGKLRLERVAGRSVAPGLIQDEHGRPTTDPEDFYAGGALLPFGLHKGFGLALIIELLGGALSGNHVGFLPEYSWGNGAVLIALDPAAFGDPSVVLDETARACRRIRTSTPADGVDAVLVPGDVEAAVRRRRSADGIPVPSGVHDQLRELADRLDVDLP